MPNPDTWPVCRAVDQARPNCGADAIARIDFNVTIKGRPASAYTFACAAHQQELVNANPGATIAPLPARP